MNKVLVAMSGGVDSSVAAALLKEQGVFVAGAYMKNFSAESWQGVLQPDCPWEKDLEDVERVCKTLSIEFRSLNFEKEYQEKVINYFFAEYGAGRTPNPDVMCNREIKFKLFLEKALDLGFDYIATGHYALINELKTQNSKRKTYELLKGIDPKKDQSYFLYTLSQDQLKHILFPIGEYTKPQVRALARDLGLPNWNKKDSQGICFVGHVNLREFLKQRLPEKIGEIVDPTGQVIGQHRGAWYYTIGQRHGLGIGGGTAYYVAQKDVTSNRLVVSKGRYHRLVYDTEITVRDINWINRKPSLPLTCRAKIRYQQPDQKCQIFPLSEQGGNRIMVEFEEAQFALAPGQAVVFYKENQVLGGGTIASKKAKENHS